MKDLKINVHDLIMVLEHLRDKEGMDEIILTEYGETIAIADAGDGEVLISFDDQVEGLEKAEIH